MLMQGVFPGPGVGRREILKMTPGKEQKFSQIKREARERKVPDKGNSVSTCSGA